MATGTRFDAEELGFFSPTMTPVESLSAGEVGYVITGLKDVSRLRVGDTLTSVKRPATEPLPGYKDVKPMVFAGLFPTDSDDYPELRDALERLKLNDAALVYEPETSGALGFGFRCGFLGLLHMEIVRERLEREFDLDLLVTAPTVAYRVQEKNARVGRGAQPGGVPERARGGRGAVRRRLDHRPEGVRRRGDGAEQRAPRHVRPSSSTSRPSASISRTSCRSRRSSSTTTTSSSRAPAATRRSTTTSSGFKPGNLVRVDVLVGGESVDALSLIIHRDFAYDRGRLLVDKLREEIPRQMFDVAIQAAIGARVIARETVKAKRKDVIAKCYGGDITRKRKLLENQKKGKKRMKQVGAVEVPQEAFLAVLNIGKGKGREPRDAHAASAQGAAPDGTGHLLVRAPAVLRAPLRLLRLRHASSGAGRSRHAGTYVDCFCALAAGTAIRHVVGRGQHGVRYALCELEHASRR